MDFRVKTPKHCVFDLVVDFLSELSHFRVLARDQLDNLLEDPCEVFVLQDQLAVGFQNIKDGVAGCKLDLGVSVPKSIYNGVNQTFQKLSFFLHLY